MENILISPKLFGLGIYELILTIPNHRTLAQDPHHRVPHLVAFTPLLSYGPHNCQTVQSCCPPRRPIMHWVGCPHFLDFLPSCYWMTHTMVRILYKCSVVRSGKFSEVNCHSITCWSPPLISTYCTFQVVLSVISHRSGSGLWEARQLCARCIAASTSQHRGSSGSLPHKGGHPLPVNRRWHSKL